MAGHTLTGPGSPDLLRSRSGHALLIFADGEHCRERVERQNSRGESLIPVQAVGGVTVGAPTWYS
jgi:hypothetical protein